MGNTIQRQEKRAFPLKLPVWLLDELRRLALEEDLSITDYTRRILIEYVRRKQRAVA